MIDFATSYKDGEKIGGRYQVIQSILGRSTEIFLCKDIVNHQYYALKTFQRQFKDSSSKYERLCREAEIWLTLGKHPNIVRCHWMESFDERPFLFLEWIGYSHSKSMTLRELIRCQKVNQRVALDLVIDICQGLKYINKELPELVHCDLKPSNILISDDRVAKISDFGLALFTKQSIQENKSSRSHRLGGTSPYTSPEQWLCEGIDIRTDIYALGCIFYELLFGQRLFTASSDQEYKNLHLELPIPKVAQNQGLPLIVDTILGKCLAKNRSDRFETIDELLNNLSILYREMFLEFPRPSLPQKDFKAFDFINRGYAYTNLKRYDLALSDLNQAIQLNPNLAQAYGNSGIVFVEIGDYSSAIDSFTKAIEIDNSNASYYANLAFSYAQIKNYSQAISSYIDAIKIEPNNVSLHLDLAFVYLCINQFEKALDEYSTLINLNSSNTELYIYRAGLYYKLNDFQSAIFDYTKAIENNYKSSKVYHCRGLAYKQIGNLVESLADYNRAMAIDETNAVLFNDRGLVYMNLNQYSQALMDFSNAIKLNPYYFQAYYNRGIVYESIDLLDQALEDYNESIKINPNYDLAYLNKDKLLNKIQAFQQV